MEIVSFTRHQFFQNLKYVYLVLIVLLIGTEFGGRFGGYSIYAKYNAPIWLYVLTILVILLLFGLLFDSIFSPKYRIGELSILNKGGVLLSGYVFMPNHLHLLVYVTANTKNLNKLIGFYPL